MKTYNIKLLNDKELNAFKDKYNIYTLDNKIVVQCKNFNRSSVHQQDKTFFLFAGGRKINITKEIIKLWIEHFKNYHIVEIQNYANMLYLMYQNPSKQDIETLILKNKK